MKKTLIHVTVGNDYWMPTDKELDSLCDLFHKAVDHKDVVVVATCRGVKVEAIPYEVDDQ